MSMPSSGSITTRRSFLQASTALAAAHAVPALTAAQVAQDLIPAVDTHQHLWDLSKLQLPWLKGAPEILSKTYGLKEYEEATRGLNVVQAVYMEVDVRPEDHVLEAETLIEICRSGKSPTVAAVISPVYSKTGSGEGNPRSPAGAAFRNGPQSDVPGSSVRQVCSVAG